MLCPFLSNILSSNRRRLWSNGIGSGVSFSSSLSGLNGPQTKGYFCFQVLITDFVLLFVLGPPDVSVFSLELGWR